jgi:hypothetical protein
MSREHIGAEIQSILVVENDRLSESYMVGMNSVTKIKAFTKSGMHADIAYVRVYKNDLPHSEFCQHNIIGVYFALSPAERKDIEDVG